jgi:hypothetical protein
MSIYGIAENGNKINDRQIINSADKSIGYINFSSVLSTAMANSKAVNLEQLFEAASKKYNVPVGLLKAVAKVESDFNPKAVSRCGARGIMQLMPGTAKDLGVTDSFDPEQNIMGGAKYLSQLLKRFHGNVEYALAAYNKGAGNVKKYGGVPPFAAGYVAKVLKYYNGIYAADSGTAGSASAMISSGLPAISSMSDKTDASSLLQLLLYMQMMAMTNKDGESEDIAELR